MLLTIFFTFTYSYYQKNALKESAKDLGNLRASLGDSVKTQLDSLSAISLNIVYSNAIKSNFKEFSNYARRGGNDAADLVASREKAMAIHDIVTAMIGAFQTASEISIYTLDGSRVDSGYWQRSAKVNLSELSWYEEVMKLRGHKYITKPETNLELPAKGENQKSHQFISLVRLFLDSHGQPEGIVEVVQDCGTVFSLVSQLENQNPGCAAYLYNERRELVYPYQKSPPSTDYYGLIERYQLAEGVEAFVKTEEGSPFLFTYEKVPNYEWTVILTKPKALVYSSLHQFRILFPIIGICSILFTLWLCFDISRRLTRPLQKLTVATGKITINRVLDESKVNLTSADSNIEELSQLCESIRGMYEKLRATSQEVLLSKSEETRAMLQATQSLINPHFLYNCLTNMSVMAEENMTEDIVKMCQALCDYFRYISASKEMIVPLEEEIFCIKRYLECMKMRYSDELDYLFDIQEETKQFLIPKLIIQPIVENAFKYGFQIGPPWKLGISSESGKDFWILKIEDNGGTLSDEKKEELLSLYQTLDTKNELKNMQIGGMGLKNVYLRLRLLYEDQAIFQIDNSVPPKTVFIVGGPIYRTREEYYAQHPQL